MNASNGFTTGGTSGTFSSVSTLTSIFNRITQALNSSGLYSIGQQSFCGDGKLNPGERCDDGNINSGDDCSSTCYIESVSLTCGDGLLNIGEECDDGNNVLGDGCSNRCGLESYQHGNGIVELAAGAEECDDGNTIAGDGCSPDGKIEPGATCGNGTVETDTEQCDNGQYNGNKPSACRLNCLLPRCGDTITDFNEVCDDGNLLDGDGCSSLCELEQGGAPLNPLLQPGQRPPATAETGPGMVIAIATGAAAGFGLARRNLLRRKKK